MNVYVFKVPLSKNDTVLMIKRVVKELNGTLNDKNVGKWRAAGYATIFPCKAHFYLFEKENLCNVRVTMDGHTTDAYRFWHTFVRKLLELFPAIDFGINADEPRYLLAVLDLTGDTQQVITASTTGGTSLGGFLLGGLAFGATGAIVGSLSGTQHTKGVAQTTFSKKVWVRVLWSDGSITEENPSKNSRLYQQIMTMLA